MSLHQLLTTENGSNREVYCYMFRLEAICRLYTIVCREKWGREVDLSPLSSAEDKNEGSCTSAPVCAFVGWKGATLHFVPSIKTY